MAIRNGVIDELPAGRDARAVFSQDGLLDELKKALAERILNAGLDQHLASERAEAGMRGRSATRPSTPPAARRPGGRHQGNPRPVDRAETEGAEFCLPATNELRSRRVSGTLTAIHDGLKGFPEAIGGVSRAPGSRPASSIRSAIAWRSLPGRSAVTPKPICRAANAGTAHAGTAHGRLEEFAAGPPGRRPPAIAPAWRRQRERAVPFFSFPIEVRRIICTTNAVESLRSRLRGAVRVRGHFPSGEAASRRLFPVLREAGRNRKMPSREWNSARTQSAVIFADRFAEE